MKHYIIVHEGGNPLVRMERFRTREELVNMLARTHNRLLDEGFALWESHEEVDNQRASTYKWVRTDERKPYIFVSVLNG